MGFVGGIWRQKNTCITRPLANLLDWCSEYSRTLALISYQTTRDLHHWCDELQKEKLSIKLLRNLTTDWQDRGTLVNSVLAALPLYLIVIYIFSFGLKKLLEKGKRDFLWIEGENGRKSLHQLGIGILKSKTWGGFWMLLYFGRRVGSCFKGKSQWSILSTSKYFKNMAFSMSRYLLLLLIFENNWSSWNLDSYALII